MNLNHDWMDLRRRVNRMQTYSGVTVGSAMVCVWEGLDGVQRQVSAFTTAELLSKVRTAIDESEREPPKAEPPKARSVQWPEPKHPSLQFGSPETEEQARARREEFLKRAQAIKDYQPPPKPKPKPPQNPYRRKFG